jgi:retron-type reverse transcriptase
MKNVPIPLDYKHLLVSLLKAPIVYNNERIESNKESGLIQGGIISPLLAN